MAEIGRKLPLDQLVIFVLQQLYGGRVVLQTQSRDFVEALVPSLVKSGKIKGIKNDGVPQEMLDVKKINDPNYDIMKHSERQYISPEIDHVLMNKYHGDGHGIILSVQSH